MKNTLSTMLSCAALCAVGLNAQQGTIIKVPFERGVYYNSQAGLVPLPTRLFMPLHDSSLRALLGVGAPTQLAVLPGAYSGLAIADPRPTFFLRGDRPGNRLYLVRATQKNDRREFRMKRHKQFAEWSRFNERDVVELEVESLGGDLARLRPASALTPGEYAIVASLEPRFTAIRLAFDFGVPAKTP